MLAAVKHSWTIFSLSAGRRTTQLPQCEALNFISPELSYNTNSPELNSIH